MLFEIELRNGARRALNVTQGDIQKNINALQRAVDGKRQAQDDTLMLDTISILEAIKRGLPK